MLKNFNGANWGNLPADVSNSAGNPLFNEVELKWSNPTVWQKDARTPVFDTDKPFLYILLRDHWNARTHSQIVYVGLTNTPKTRFGNHETAKALVKKAGTLKFTYAPVDFSGRNRAQRIKDALEELEHLLIWAVPVDHLVNEKKQFTLPGMGKNGGSAWHIKNTGYRFSGQMPREVVFPWMMVLSGRDRSTK